MKFLVSYILLLSFSFSSIAQINAVENDKNLSSLKSSLIEEIDGINFIQQIQSFQLQASKNGSFSILHTKNQQNIPAAYSYKDLAFFCKIEVLLEKNVKLPVKFRLGSVDYVDYLEGKRSDY